MPLLFLIEVAFSDLCEEEAQFAVECQAATQSREEIMTEADKERILADDDLVTIHHKLACEERERRRQAQAALEQELTPRSSPVEAFDDIRYDFRY